MCRYQLLPEHRVACITNSARTSRTPAWPGRARAPLRPERTAHPGAEAFRPRICESPRGRSVPLWTPSALETEPQPQPACRNSSPSSEIALAARRSRSYGRSIGMDRLRGRRLSATYVALFRCRARRPTRTGYRRALRQKVEHRAREAPRPAPPPAAGPARASVGFGRPPPSRAELPDIPGRQRLEQARRHFAGPADSATLIAASA